MNPLSQEQIQQIQSFTPEQKTLYNQTRSAGISAQDALDVVMRAEANKNVPTPTGDGILTGQKSLLSGVAKGVKEAVTGGVRETGDIAKKYGTMEAIKRAPLSMIAGVGRGVGDLFGTVFETADDLTGEVASNAIQPIVNQAVNSPFGQKVIKGAEKINQDTHGVAGDLLDASNLLGLGALKSAPAKALKDKIVTGIKDGVSTATESFTGGKSLKELLRKSGDVIKNTAKETPIDEVSKTIDVVSPTTFNDAVSRGFAPQEARLFSNLTETDKGVANKMLKLSEDIDAGKVDATTRPIDIVGNNVKTRLNSLEKIESELGKGVDETAKTLNNLPINEDELHDGLFNTINEYKIKRTNKGWDFSDSDFALTKNVQGDISEALDYVFSPKKDAYSVHRIKKTLDGLIYPQKASEGLSGRAKSLIQKLRRDVDTYLDNNFEAYKLANDDFSKVKNVLDEARDTLKDFNEGNLAQKIRQVFSNSPKREEFKAVIKKIDDLAKEKGLPDIGNIYNQALFAEKLIDLFGDKAVTGFGESIKRAITRAQAVANGLKNPIKGAGELAGTIIEKVARQSPEDKLNFLKKLLGEDLKGKGGIPETNIPEELKKLYETAPEAKKHIDDMADMVAARYNGMTAKPGLKKMDRAMQKVMAEYEGNYAKLTDIARNTVVTDKANVKNAFDDIIKQADVVGSKLETHDKNVLGYSGALIKVKTPNGHIAEIQVNTPEMIFAKERPEDAIGILGKIKYEDLKVRYEEKGIKGGLGHVYYEQFRNLPRMEQALGRENPIAKKSIDYYSHFQ